jgi:hypothetical protein
MDRIQDLGSVILKNLFCIPLFPHPRSGSKGQKAPSQTLIFLRISVADPHQFQCGTFDLNTDPDPDPNPDPRSQTNADPGPDPGQTLKSQKVEVCFEDRKPGLFVNFVQFPCSWIGISITNADPDPGQPNQCGSGSGIHNTA